MKIEIAFSNVNCAIKITTPEGNIIDIVPTLRPEPEVPVATAETEYAAPVTVAAAPDTKTVETAALSEKIISMNREYERLKKAVYRAKKKLEATTASLGQMVTAAAASCPSPAFAGCPSPALTHYPAPVPAGVPRVPETCPQVVSPVPQNVPGDNWGQGTVDITYGNTSNNNYYNKTMSHKSITNPTFIPLAKLPEVYQKIITAWNNLPLPEKLKLKGLFTDRAQELYTLLKQFGKAAVYKAIRTVAECPFLLGKSANSSGWIISFGWLLKPHNMEKVLADKYRDTEKYYKSYDNYSLAYAPWLEEGTDTETCYIDPAVMTEGVTKLSDHTRNCLNHAAKLLGLKKEATA